MRCYNWGECETGKKVEARPEMIKHYICLATAVDCKCENENTNEKDVDMWLE